VELLQDAKALLQQKSAAHVSQLSGTAGRIARYHTPISGQSLPNDWHRLLSHMSGTIWLDCNAIASDQLDSDQFGQFTVLVNAIGQSMDLVGICMLPMDSKVQGKVQFQLLSACQSSSLEWRMLTVPLKGKRGTPGQSGEARVMYLLIIGKSFQDTPGALVTMQQRIAKTEAFQSLTLQPLDHTISDEEEKTMPRKRNGAHLWEITWSVKVWMHLMQQLTVWPVAAGDLLIELEASPNLVTQLLPSLVEKAMDSNASGEAIWLGCHFYGSPAKQKYLQDSIQRTVTNLQSEAKPSPSVRRLVAQKSDTDDNLSCLYPEFFF